MTEFLESYMESHANEENWMVIGYSKTEGEYPVRLNITKAEALALAEKNNQSKPKYPEGARCMTSSETGRDNAD